VVDAYGYPANTMDDVRWRNSRNGLRTVNNRANLLKAGDVLDSVALDKYSLVRDILSALSRVAAGVRRRWSSRKL
jgi:phospholipid-binding lipoprotein MlaA